MAAPATRKALWTSKSCVLTISTSRSLSRKFCGVQLQKVCRNHIFLTILTSKSPRHSVVQILWTWTSTSAPTPPVFNDFDFRIALAPQRGANFVDIFGSRSSATPAFRSWEWLEMSCVRWGENRRGGGRGRKRTTERDATEENQEPHSDVGNN